MKALATQKQLSDVRAPVREADWSVWTVAAGLDHCIATAPEVARRKISDSPGQEDESSRRVVVTMVNGSNLDHILL